MGQRGDRSGVLQRVLRRTAWAVGVVMASAVVPVAPSIGPADTTASASITIAFTGDDLGSPALWPAARRNADGPRPRLPSDAGPAPALDPFGRPGDLSPGDTAVGTGRAAVGFAPIRGAPSSRHRDPVRRLRRVFHRLEPHPGRGHRGHPLNARRPRRPRTSRTRGAHARRPSLARSFATRSGDVGVAHLAYTFGFNGLRPNHPWMANRIDPDTIIARAERVAPRGRGSGRRELALGPGAPATRRRPIRIGSRDGSPSSDAIDLIVGHHAHVVQPIRRSTGRWVAFGAGNSLTGMTAREYVPDVQDGMVVLATFAADGRWMAGVGDPVRADLGAAGAVHRPTRRAGARRGSLPPALMAGAPPVVGTNGGHGGRARDRREAVPRGAPLGPAAPHGRSRRRFPRRRLRRAPRP